MVRSNEKGFKSFEVAYGGLDNPSGHPVGYAHLVELGDGHSKPKPYLLPAVKRVLPPYQRKLRQAAINSWERNIRAAGFGGGWKKYGKFGAIKWISNNDVGRAGSPSTKTL
jgi:hypothetical protein